MGGLAFGRGSQQREEGAVRFTEMQGSLLAIGVWVAFGLTLAGNLLTHLWDPAAIAYAILSLTVIRMVPVAIALAGERFQPLSVLFMGWFGPRGLASIVFLVIGLEGLRGGGVDPGPLAKAVAWTVFLSVIVHGLTAGPLAARYGRRMAGMSSDAPEFQDAAEPHPSRVDVGRGAPLERARALSPGRTCAAIQWLRAVAGWLDIDPPATAACDARRAVPKRDLRNQDPHAGRPAAHPGSPAPSP